MSENTPLTAELIGYCQGATGEQIPPVFPRIIVESSGQPKATVVCDLLGANGKCEATGAEDARCVFLASAVESEKERILHCTTNAGVLIYDSFTRDLLSSPLLPVDQERIRLRRAEGSILTALIHNQGQVLSRAELEQTYNPIPFERPSRAVDIIITGLRKSLGEPSRGSGEDYKIIQTVKRAGYTISFPQKQ